MAMNLRDVRGFRTFIDIVNTPNFREFRKAMGLAARADSSGKYELEKEAKKIVCAFFEPVLKDAGIFLSGDEGSHSGDIYFDSQRKLRVYGDGIPIASGGKEREEFLDGYDPEVEFTILNEGISTVSKLRREGRGDLCVLEDVMLNLYEDGDGISKPKVRRSREKGGELIYVASVFQMSRVIEAMKQIYRRIRGKNFNSLCDLDGAIKCLSHEQKGSSVIPGLRRQYYELVQILTPRDL